MNNSLGGFTFEPSVDMMQQRFVERLTELVGTHVRKIAEEHMEIATMGDSITVTVGEPLMAIIRSVYGDDLVAMFAPNSVVTLNGWRMPERCESIPTTPPTITVPLPVARPVEQETKAASKKKKKRPKSLGVWRGD